MNETILNRLDIFRNLICQEINRLGGTEEDKSVALAATLGLDSDSIPAAINRAARQWVAEHCGLRRVRHHLCNNAVGPSIASSRFHGAREDARGWTKAGRR